MKTKKQNTAIATVLGYHDIAPKSPWFGLDADPLDHVPNGELIGYYRSCTTPSQIRDYTEDLNAMWGAEGVLPLRLHLTYIDHLVEITDSRELKLIGATAAQRAEAFLRTLGKWEESA